MILNVIIADDEYFIRQRIKKIIPWESLSLRFAGEAENGEEVMELLQKHVVDILILDIKMPKMDGIQVAAAIQEYYPHTKVLILSGYNDFEYARSSIRYGVVDYLLKPVEPHLLTAALSACIARAEEDRRLSAQLMEYHHYELCSQLSGVVSGKSSVASLCTLFPSFSNYNYTLYLGIFLARQPDENLKDLVNALRARQYTCEYWQDRDSLYVVQIFFRDKETSRFLSGLLEAWSPYDPNNFSFLIMGGLFPMDTEWRPHLQRILKGMTQRFFYETSALIHESDLPVSDGESENLRAIRQSLIQCLNGGDEDQFSAYIEDLFREIHKKRDGEFLYLAVTEIFVTYHMYYKLNASENSGLNELVSSVLDGEYRIEELSASVLSYGMECMQKNKATPSDLSMSKRVMAFIQEHYQESNLTVSQIAEVFQLNSSYMGTAFKRINNLSVLQYLTQVRMEAAQALLRTGTMKVSEVAERVGYPDVFYFSRKFKKFFGCSPKDSSNRI